MLANLQVPLTWRELAKRTVKETIDDDGMGLAAQLAYYFFLSLFPALLCLIAIASLFPLQNFTGSMTGMLAPFVPSEVLEIIRKQMMALGESNDGGLLSVGLLGAIWSSSAAMVAIVSTMNAAYDIQEARPWWKVRLISVLLTVGLAVFIMISFTLVIAGPEIAEVLARHLGLGPAFVATWKVLQWPVAFSLVATALGLIYYFAPDAEQEWVWVTPGSVLATALWLIASLGFRYYVVNFGNYDATYGAIGGIILLLLWFYISGLVIIIGAEMNAEIEHASPWGKSPGEKVPTGKKKIGIAAAKAYREHGTEPPEAIEEAAKREEAERAAMHPTMLTRLVALVALYVHWRRKSK